MRITSVHAREILDSRGNPTVEVELTVSYRGSSCIGREQVPSGASTGIHEALELRDHDNKRFLGKGVLTAVHNVNTILAPHLIGKDPRKQREIDLLLKRIDGTAQKSRLGANALLGVSLACARATANAEGLPLYQYLDHLLSRFSSVSASLFGHSALLPIPFLNVINGGKHASTPLAFQEYMLVPFGKTYAESLRMGAEVYHQLQKLLNAENKPLFAAAINVGDEGGCTPPFHSVEEPLQFLTRAIRAAGYSGKVRFAIDVAASELYHKGKYYVDEKYHSPEELMKLYDHLIKKYPLVSIEDPFDQEDFKHCATLLRHHPKLQVVGDDLLVTNPSRIRKAIKEKSCNALLLKVNQIGTLSEALDAAQLAIKAGWKVMVSHRSGETESTFIADLAVALGTGQIKAGAPCRGERVAKYNQLLRIESELGRRARYAGRGIKSLR